MRPVALGCYMRNSNGDCLTTAIWLAAGVAGQGAPDGCSQQRRVLRTKVRLLATHGKTGCSQLLTMHSVCQNYNKHNITVTLPNPFDVSCLSSPDSLVACPVCSLVRCVVSNPTATPAALPANVRDAYEPDEQGKLGLYRFSKVGRCGWECVFWCLCSGCVFCAAPHDCPTSHL